jgi:predicted metal-dependent enzyme (double-stranded beta helix superfamily)
MTSIAEIRRRLVEALIEETRATLDAGNLDRARLDGIKQQLHALSQKKELWGEVDYPAPGEDERQNRFLVDQESPEGISLYLNVMRPGKKIPPHNHTTWACIAAVEGAEHNTLYDRHDNGSVEGKADVRPRDVVALKPGTALAMMPDDIHSVEIRGDEVIRHLHLYGRPLETLTQRLTFDLDAGACRIMDIGVKTKA